MKVFVKLKLYFLLFFFILFKIQSIQSLLRNYFFIHKENEEKKPQINRNVGSNSSFFPVTEAAVDKRKYLR
jgi:Na+-transporting methylmalonyl-CoA/oxaloacetate decarboxylase gamma subunit